MKPFANANDYMDYIKQIHEKPLPQFKLDPGFVRVTLEHAEKVGAKFNRHVDPLNSVVGDLFAEIERYLPPKLKSDMRQHVACGCLDHFGFNARIFSHDGHYSIVIHKGLMLLFNTIVKFICASKAPQDVEYLTIGEPSAFNAEQYAKLARDAIVEYSKSRNLDGPDLKFKLGSNSLDAYATQLHLIELFIMGHEIGHYVNGDLKSVANFKAISDYVSVFDNAANHEKEYMADEVAFEAVLRSAADMFGEDHPAIVMLAVPLTIFFDVVAMLSDKDSYSHPSPRKRLLSLTSKFYGEGVASLMEKSYSAPELSGQFNQAAGNITLGQLLSRWDSSGAARLASVTA